MIVGAHSRPLDLRVAVQRLSSLPLRSTVTRACDSSAFRRRTWLGRFLIHPINTQEYLLHCMRYVDLNPVEAGIVKRPEEYEWSSYRAHIGLTACLWLTPAPCITALAATTERQQVHYRKFVEQGIR